jgi:hypothetical protein
MTDSNNTHPQPLLPFHRGWGGFAEELYHYTSRYYFATEAFLRNLADDRGFSMGGYKAAQLSVPQRELMAAVLSFEPDRRAGLTVTTIVDAVRSKDPGVEQAWVDIYRRKLAAVPKRETLRLRNPVVEHDLPRVPPYDPFLSVAERLQMPAAVRDHHVEVSMQTLAEHLDSANPTLRANLQSAVIQLHNAGYVLRNHPHLTHSEAHQIGDEDAV